MARSVPANSMPFADRIFAHGVDHFVIGNAVGDLLPCLAAVVGAIDVRAQIVQAEAVDGGIDRLVIEMRGVELRYFAPRRKIGRRDVVPRLAAIASDVDQAVVGAGPQSY